MFTSRFLKKMRMKAIRRGIWYKTLDRTERGIISLSSQIIDKVRSCSLGIEIVKILAKLRKAMKSGFVRQMKEFGYKRAREFTLQALEWGYKAAKDWALDITFIKYLTFMEFQ